MKECLIQPLAPSPPPPEPIPDRLIEGLNDFADCLLGNLVGCKEEGSDLDTVALIEPLLMEKGVLSAFEPADRRFAREAILNLPGLVLKQTKDLDSIPDRTMIEQYFSYLFTNSKRAHEEFISKRLGKFSVKLGGYLPGPVERAILDALDEEGRLSARAQLAAQRARLRQD